MNNCLVTRMKAVVNNDNLVKLGIVEFVNKHLESATPEDTYHVFKAPNSTLSKMKTVTNGIEGAGLSYENGVSGGNQYTMDIIRLYDKYNYTELLIGQGFSIANVESLENCNALTCLNIKGLNVPDYVLGAMTALIKVEQNTIPTGTAEKLAEIARAKGRTSGYIYHNWNMGNLTLGKWRITSPVQHCIVQWDEDFEWSHNSDSISISNATIVCTNLKTSESRINEWRTAGKTVRVYDNGSLVQEYAPING